MSQPAELAVVDRLQHGKYFGTIIETSNGLKLNKLQVESWVRSEKAKIELLEQEQHKLYQLLDALPKKNALSDENKKREDQLNEQAKAISNQLSHSYLILQDSQGEKYKLSSDNVVDIWFPNMMTLKEKQCIGLRSYTILLVTIHEKLILKAECSPLFLVLFY